MTLVKLARAHQRADQKGLVDGVKTCSSTASASTRSSASATRNSSADLVLSAQQAVHGRHRAQVAYVIQQVDAGWRLVHEAVSVQDAEHFGTFRRAILTT